MDERTAVDPRASTRTLAAATLLTALFVVAVAYDWTPYLRGPAPWPDEWRWGLRESPPARGPWAALGWTALLAGAMVAAPQAVARLRRTGIAITAVAIIIAGFGLQLALLSIEGGASGTDLLFQRIRSASFTSVHTVAVHPGADDIPRLLANYDELMPQLPGHARVHPPGRTLFFRYILEAVERSPTLMQTTLSWGEQLGMERTPAVPPGVELPKDFTLPDEPDSHAAAAMLGGWILLLIACLSTLTVAGLASALGSPIVEALRIGALWAIVPGFALMTPTFDQALAAPITATCALLIWSLNPRATTRQRLLAAIAAGTTAGLTLFFSFGAALFLLFAGLVAIAAGLATGPIALARGGSAIAIAAALAGALFLLPQLSGYAPLNALKHALAYHSETITAARDRGTWLAFNLLDLAVFAGVPVIILGAAKLGQAFASARRRSIATTDALIIAVFTGLLVIDLTGTVRGEVGRIWVPLMPFPLLCATLSVKRPARWWLAMLALLAASTLAIRLFWHAP